MNTGFGARFLAAPPPQPDGAAGFGNATTYLTLAGDIYRFSGLHPDQAADLAANYPGNLVTPPAGTALFSRADTRILRAMPGLFRHGDFDRGEYTYQIRHDGMITELAGAHFFARIQRGKGTRGWLWLDAADDWYARQALHNYLRALTACHLAASERVLVHSAAICLDRGVVLFAGHSGAGKSTLAGMALAAGYPVLSDDMNALAPRDERVQVIQLPFTGTLDAEVVAHDGEARYLRAVCLLEQASRDSIIPVGTQLAFSRLLGLSLVVNGSRPLFHRLSDTLRAVVTTVPAYRLCFRRHPAVLDKVAKHLSLPHQSARIY